MLYIEVKRKQKMPRYALSSNLDKDNNTKAKRFISSRFLLSSCSYIVVPRAT